MAVPTRKGFWRRLGSGGFISLILATLSAVIMFGIPLWRCRRKVMDASKGGSLRSADAILVLGRRLASNQLTDVFRQRLEHAASLWLMGIAPRIILSGGFTGNASRSEAEAGRQWLEERGLPDEAVLLEDRSQHTLENLFNVRKGIQARGWSSLILVSDPLHLARALTFSKGFGLDVIGSPAVACPPRRGSFGWWARSVREAFLLHWYCTGLVYVRLIRSERELARVT